MPGKFKQFLFEEEQKKKRGRPVGSTKTNLDKEPKQGEFNKDVKGYVVFTDIKNNKYILSKDMKKWISIENSRLENLNAFEFNLGKEEDKIENNKKKEFSKLPIDIAGKDKYEDEIEIMDEFQLSEYF